MGLTTKELHVFTCDAPGEMCDTEFEYQGTKEEAAREAGAEGWSFTKEYGWLCPHCTDGRAWYVRKHGLIEGEKLWLRDYELVEVSDFG